MIKKKYPANTPEIKKLSQQAVTGIFSAKNHYASRSSTIVGVGG